MKRRIVTLILLFAFFLSADAQKRDTAFQREWLNIDTLIAKGNLTKSALNEINAVYQKAKQKQLHAQVLKTLVYRYSLEESITDNQPNRAVTDLKKEISQSTDDIQRSVLYALLAKKYLAYYNNHRWNLYGRTNTATTVKDDIATWSANDFATAINNSFVRSIANKTKLLQQKTDGYDAVIIPGNTRALRPTLYDLLAHEALNYYKAAEINSTKPINAFTISNEVMFAPVDVFVKSKFPTTDSSQQWMAVQLFQQLLTTHLNDANKDALVALDIERIEWIYSQATLSNKEALYKNALEDLIAKNGSASAAATAWYLLAKIESDKAAGYQAFTDTANRYGYVKAKQMAEKALSILKEKNTGTANLKNLLIDITTKKINGRTELVNIPDKPLRALINYRNIDSVFVRVVRLEIGQRLPEFRGDKEFWSSVLKLPVVKTFVQPLPFIPDYQEHNVEVKIDALPVGSYALVVSDNKNFSSDVNKLSAQVFHVSNISFIQNGNDFYVLRRDNGKPISNAKVVIENGVYDSKKTKWNYDALAERSSDEDGYFYFFDSKHYSNLNFVFSKDRDKLDLKQQYYNYSYDYEESLTDIAEYEEKSKRIFFYVDRGIYRPGQTVYFKGIAATMEQKTKRSKLYLSKKPILVYLHDANGKNYDSVSLTLNSYGSFNGKFQLPQNVLTGRFSLRVKDFHAVTAEFNVEEYKRPTFNVTFDKVKGAYRLNDSITVTGSANAFAGNHIDGAKVVYNVTRNTRFIPYYYSRIPGRSQVSRAIAHGELVTDASGRFTIKFKASADDIVDKSGNPVLDFSVSADVTDVSGETRSNNTTVSAGTAALVLQVLGEDVMDTDSLKRIRISATNLSYEKEPAVVDVKIYALQSPNRAVKKRYWQRPDAFVMTQQEFIRYFPNDEYEAESDEHTWATGALVKEANMNTKDQDSLLIAAGSLTPGFYRIEVAAKDKFGAEVKTSRYLEIFSSRKKQTSVPKFQFNYVLNDEAKPGEKAVFISSSVADNLYVLRRTEKPTKKSKDIEFTNKKENFETIVYTPSESDRGGVIINEAYVYDNRVYTYQYKIDVPWSNKELKVQYTTYRDKTEPGSKETWSITVQNEKNEKAGAELMTAMYDASLDQFRANNWQVPDLWDSFRPMERTFSGINNFTSGQATENYIAPVYAAFEETVYDHLASEAYELWNKNLNRWITDSTLILNVALKESLGMLNESVAVAYGVKTSRDRAPGVAANVKIRGASSMNAKMDVAMAAAPKIVSDEEVKEQDANQPPIQSANIVTRKNFNETAFFFPQLYEDSTGKFTFNFTIPESLTQWKWISLAHTKDLAFGTNSATIVTQKKLMAQANAPRFMREGDNMEFSGKIVNMSEKEITGQASLELIDPITNTSVDGWFQNVFPVQYFTVEAGQSFAVKFPIQIPFSYNRPLTWRIKAVSGGMSDGEENTLPVLTNRMLVTETLPIFLPNDTTQHFVFEKLRNNKSESLTHEAITVEYSTNPVWYAVQSLPYLMEYPYECAEQTFNRLYANALASYIVNKHPKLKQVFEQWQKDSSSLKSNLQKNEELKQILLQETPWVMQAESEAQQRRNISLLFDLAKISTQTEALVAKLSDLQLPNGSFPWFKGGTEDRYITNYILTGIGKLKRLGALSPGLTARIRTVLANALKYADSKMAEDYQSLIRSKADLTKQTVYSTQIDYLFMRSFFRDISVQPVKEFDYYFNLAKKDWTKQNNYNKAKLGLIYLRNNEEKFATTTIFPALLENTVIDSKQGMYWKNTYTDFWYQSPIEHQSMMIAFASELNLNKPDPSLVKNINAMKTWLLLNKQTNNWRTTIATADACYALLLNGTDWLEAEKKVTIQFGKTTVSSANEKTEAGTGYFKKRIDGKNVTPEMGDINITVETKNTPSQNTKTNSAPSWGNIYWQYFEDLDKITPAATPLSLSKKLFIQRNTDKGVVLDPVQENQELKTGDKVIVRLELRSDRDMDYLHLKDMRAAAMEPVNVLSSYKWQDGLGYYESTKDASTNFFFGHMRKGTYVFEYPLFITHTGIFSVGIASIQCMYAPEFTSHSGGIKIRVAK